MTPDIRIRKLCEAIAEEYTGELAVKIDETGRLVVEVSEKKEN